MVSSASKMTGLGSVRVRFGSLVRKRAQGKGGLKLRLGLVVRVRIRLGLGLVESYLMSAKRTGARHFFA
eukprot:1325486-Amorphochlora_amoeboformis.AAC.1